MFTTLTPTDWLKLSLQTRLLLIEKFSITRSAGTIVEDNTIRSDGHTEKDLEALRVEVLQSYTGLTTKNYIDLFNKTLEKLYEEKGLGQTSSGKTPETTGQNENNSAGKDISNSRQVGGDSLGSPDDNANTVSGAEPSVSEPNQNTNSGTNESPKRGRPKKQVLRSDEGVA